MKTMRKNEVVMAAVGTRGVSLFIGVPSANKQAVTPAFDHDGNRGSFDTVPVGPGQLIPWTKNPTGKAVHAWVSHVGQPVTIVPLAYAEKTKLVKRVMDGNNEVLVPASYQAGQKLPQYVGFEGNLPLGRIEGKKVRNGDKSIRNAAVLRQRAVRAPKAQATNQAPAAATKGKVLRKLTPAAKPGKRLLRRKK